MLYKDIVINVLILFGQNMIGNVFLYSNNVGIIHIRQSSGSLDLDNFVQQQLDSRSCRQIKYIYIHADGISPSLLLLNH